jgi:uncharacterized membrane protein required for colicin V production
VAGSPLWQVVFVSFAVVLILFEVVRGWRLGLLRQLVRVAGLVAAYAAAVFGGRLLLPIARPFLKMPDIVLSLLVGAVLALVIYALVTSMGMLKFKRTRQQNSQLGHVIHGFAGAIVGLIFGAFVLWLILASVRAVGAVADAQVRSQANSPNTDQTATMHALDVRRRFLSEPNAGFYGACHFVSSLKEFARAGAAWKSGQTDRPGPAEDL